MELFKSVVADCYIIVDYDDDVLNELLLSEVVLSSLYLSARCSSLVIIRVMRPTRFDLIGFSRISEDTMTRSAIISLNPSRTLDVYGVRPSRGFLQSLIEVILKRTLYAKDLCRFRPISKFANRIGRLVSFLEKKFATILKSGYVQPDGIFTTYNCQNSA